MDGSRLSGQYAPWRLQHRSGRVGRNRDGRSWRGHDPAIEAVRIHVSPIRGEVSVVGNREDPRSTVLPGQQAIANQVYYEDKLNSAIYVSVTGLSPAAFSIVVTG